jgi:hypothetical protein
LSLRWCGCLVFLRGLFVPGARTPGSVVLALPLSLVFPPEHWRKTHLSPASRLVPWRVCTGFPGAPGERLWPLADPASPGPAGTRRPGALGRSAGESPPGAGPGLEPRRGVETRRAPRAERRRPVPDQNGTEAGLTAPRAPGTQSPDFLEECLKISQCQLLFVFLKHVKDCHQCHFHFM